MFWKAILITTFAIGALAEHQITEDQLKQYSILVYNDILMQFCKNNGAEDKADEVQTAITNYVDCIMGIIDFDTLMKEIVINNLYGTLAEVFKKYCAKSPQLKTCIHTVTTGVSPCFDSNMRDSIGLANEAADQLIDFVCYKDGDRITRFIAEGGPECFQEKFNTIRECTTMRVHLGKWPQVLPREIQRNPRVYHNEAGTSSVDELKKLSIDERCTKYDEFTTCIVKALEECSTPTSGNMAETLFRYMRYNSPCPVPKDVDEIRNKKAPNSASGLAVTSLTLSAIALPLLV